jgi:hypothetical protein
MTFGIPKGVLPINCDGEVDLTHHKEWLMTMEAPRQEAMEQAKLGMDASKPDSTKTTSSSNNKKPILVPGPMDVVMGRGRHSQNSPGNLRLRHLLQKHRGQYEEASKFEKTVVAEIALKIMKDSGCRFLKSTKLGWVECEDQVARDKISHAFRNLRGMPYINNPSNNSGSKEKRSFDSLMAVVAAAP